LKLEVRCFAAAAAQELICHTYQSQKFCCWRLLTINNQKQLQYVCGGGMRDMPAQAAGRLA
jgi:hypothetical protein